ncbi:hypothetical protein QYF61_025185 [Mycteria americana]|uniref:ribonuclease H n=1 Tax=Mycteria americana TaxID=33587 RepID=A0AAN7N4G7_MYCAM|nr:hypothetical protein QYF61_025185 [Mycteria americana]
MFMLQDSSKEEQIPEEVENALTPLVWAKPVKVTLKPGAKPVRQKQYPIKWEARKGLEGLIKKFLEYGLLVECESEYNTPIWLVRKSGSKEYPIVQDLRAINQIVQDIHPVVANPYTLLTSLKEEHKWFTVLDLKDAFFCISLDTESQNIFAFEWESPATGRKMQLTWTPYDIWESIGKGIRSMEKTEPREKYIVAMDDILIAAENKEKCFEMTISLLNFLGQGGYRVSRNKAQIRKEVIYLGFEISQGQRQLGNERKEAIWHIPEPNSPKELRAFLGMIGWCRLWILNYGLYKSFKELKKALMMAPALGLPDLTKPFELFVYEKQHLALGVLAQRLRSWKQLVGYFSKQLDNVSKGWPGCLHAVAATVLLIQEARKLTMGQKMVVYVPHMVVLLEQDDVELKTTAIVNPAMFLPTENPIGNVEHDCLLTIEQVYSSRPDLRDEPLENPDLELFTDGSSFVQEGRRMAGYAVVTTTKVLQSGTLPANTSAQKAELMALKQALRMAKGKRVHIWNQSIYLFGVIHAHGAIWKERGVLSAQGSPIKHKEEILQLLEDVQKPKEVAVMHCKADQFGQTSVNIGNRLADKAAKEAAERGILALVPVKQMKIPNLKLKYNKLDEQLVEKLKASQNTEGWWVTPEKQVRVTPQVMLELAKEKHEQTHWGVDAFKFKTICRMTGIIKSIVAKCPICLKNNPLNQRKAPLGVTKQALIDTFSGWPEAFPCCSNKAREVVKILLREIIPRFGVPIGMSSDRGPHFVAEIVQQVSRILGINWDLHTPWRPQSSGKIERMNQTLKRQISKVCQEVSLKWPQALTISSSEN